MENKPIRIFIADDHQMMIDGISSLLKNEKRFIVEDFASDGISALEKIRIKPPDVLIADINMPLMGGIELTREARRKCPLMKVLVLTMYNDIGIINEIMATGANGYILKNTGKQELIAALDAVCRGESYYSREVVNKMIENLRNPEKERKTEHLNSPELTGREKEILTLITKEFSSATIADKLYISLRTVETHRKNIIRKTGAKTLAGLIKYAYDNHLAG